MARMAAIGPGGRTLIVATAAILAACGELPQDGPKPFVTDGTYGNSAVPAPHSRARENGLAERASFQDEYVLLEEKSKVALTASAQ